MCTTQNRTTAHNHDDKHPTMTMDNNPSPPNRFPKEQINGRWYVPLADHERMKREHGEVWYARGRDDTNESWERAQRDARLQNVVVSFLCGMALVACGILIGGWTN